MAELKPKAKEGRPLLFNSPEEMETKADNYFKICDKEGKVPLLGEMAVALGCSRYTLANYADKDEFFPIVMRIRTRCEAGLERQLVSRETYCPGQFTILRNGHGWSDSSNVNHSGSVESSSVAVIEAMGAFANLLQQSAKQKLVEGEVIEGE